MSEKAKVQLFPDAAALCRAAAEHFARRAREFVAQQGVFNVVLSGGSTPKGMFQLLVSESSFKDAIPWKQIQFFWGDERHVPPDHADSNYRMTQETLLSKAPVPAGNIHRIKSELSDTSVSASGYRDEIKQCIKKFENGFPCFDLAFLGMGPDGHTASLFPGTKALAEKNEWVVANWVGKFYTWRITLTAPVFNHAAEVVFLAGGDDKAQPLKAVLEGPYEPEQLPAQLISPVSGKLLWMVDVKAAALLEK